MRGTRLCLVLGVFACVAYGQEEAAPAAKDPAASAQPATPTVTVPMIIRYPRSIDTMARLWMALFGACQQAGVPANAVLVQDVKHNVDVTRAGNASPADSADMPVPSRMGLGMSGIELGVEAGYFPALVEALVAACGVPESYVPYFQDWDRIFEVRDTAAFLVQWTYFSAWPNTYPLGKGKMVLGNDHTGAYSVNGQLCEGQFIRLNTIVHKDNVPRELKALTEKYGIVGGPRAGGK